MSLWSSPLCRLRIKATFLFPPNSVFIFFIQLGWAKNAKILASHTLTYASQSLLFTQRILFIHNGLPQVTLPLCLDVKPHCFCSGLCPPVDHYRKEKIDTSPPPPLLVLSGKEHACQCRRHKRHKFDPWISKRPWRRKWQPTPVFLPGGYHGQSSLAGYSLCSA